MNESNAFQQQRSTMVSEQIAGRGVSDKRVLDAMRRVPRECFVAADMAARAYEDTPLPIEEGQTISQPYIVALMLEAAELAPADRVLEIGSGSGYASAVASLIGARVDAVERHPRLAALAAQRLARGGYSNVAVHCGDGSGGWPDAGPFDAIIVSASGPRVPEALRDQLAIGGRLVMPVGDAATYQRLVKLTRVAADEFREADLGGVVFVPLIGTHGWAPGEADRS